MQIAPVDGVRTFATIQEALASIGNASAGNPFVVKVMPGTYTESVYLKPYVALEGSGAESTVLTTADGAVSPTLTVGNETRVADLTVSAGTASTLVVEDGAKTRIADATLVMPPRGAGRAISSGPGARVELDRVRVVLDGANANTGDVALDVRQGAALVVRRSHLAIDATSGAVFVTILGDNTPTEIYDTTFDLRASVGQIEVVDSAQVVTKIHRCSMRVADEDPSAGGFYAMSGAFEIIDSTLVATGSASYAARLYGPSTIQRSTLTSEHGGLRIQGATTVMNSMVGGSETGINGSAVWVANSTIAGAISDPSGTARITNCVDQNFDPITNR